MNVVFCGDVQIQCFFFAVVEVENQARHWSATEETGMKDIFYLKGTPIQNIVEGLHYQ